nr:MAG TPA: hypothetical protein [Caudoviricetes sp.]
MDIIPFPLRKHKSRKFKNRVSTRFRACLQYYLFGDRLHDIHILYVWWCLWAESERE